MRKRSGADPQGGQSDLTNPLAELEQRYLHDAQSCPNATPLTSEPNRFRHAPNMHSTFPKTPHSHPGRQATWEHLAERQPTPSKKEKSVPFNGWRYPLGVGGWISPRNGSPPKSEKSSKNAARTPSRVHALLGAVYHHSFCSAYYRFYLLSS